jgi:hypothetical protein
MSFWTICPVHDLKERGDFLTNPIIWFYEFITQPGKPGLASLPFLKPTIAGLSSLSTAFFHLFSFTFRE